MLLVLYFDVLLPLFVKFWRFHGKFNWFWFDLLNPGVWSFVDYNLGSWPCRYSDIKHPLDVERRPLSFCHSGSGVLRLSFATCNLNWTFFQLLEQMKPLVWLVVAGVGSLITGWMDFGVGCPLGNSAHCGNVGIY